MTFNTNSYQCFYHGYIQNSAYKSNTQESYYTVSNTLTDRRLIL